MRSEHSFDKIPADSAPSCGGAAELPSRPSAGFAREDQRQRHRQGRRHAPPRGPQAPHPQPTQTARGSLLQKHRGLNSICAGFRYSLFRLQLEVRHAH